MKNILCICNTYFQLLTVIQMKLTLFEDREMSLILSNHSNNSAEVFQTIMDMKLFKNCYYVYTKVEVKEKNIISEVIDLMSFTFANDGMWILLGLERQDEIIYFNQTDEIYSLFSFLYEKNSQIKISRMEEGILSYNGGVFSSKKAIITKFLRHITGKKAIDDSYHNFYCFYPEFYKGNMNPVKIPPINNELGEILSEIFQVDIPENAYQEKYIYFSSVYDFEGGEPIGELELIKQIAKVVGKDNLLVKVHPRDDIKKFEKEGVKVDKNSNVPWEVVQLGRDFSNHVFMTANSTSVLSISLLQKNAPKIFFMYKLCNLTGNLSAQKTVKEIEAVISANFVKDSNTVINIAKHLDDILE